MTQVKELLVTAVLFGTEIGPKQMKWFKSLVGPVSLLDFRSRLPFYCFY